MRRRKRNRFARLVLTFGCVCAILALVLVVVVHTQVLRVRNIQVVGNRNLLSEEVITQSGVQLGEHLWKITSGRLREQLEVNRYIEFLSYSFDYRGTLTIRINERQGRAVISEQGKYYVLDQSGVVLEVAGVYYPTEVPGPLVSGLAFRSYSQLIVGEKFPVVDEAQLAAMEKVLRALDEVGMLASVSALNVSNLDNIYYKTGEDTRVELGDTSNLTTKLLTAREVISMRETKGDLYSAKIDVSTVGKAHFIPADLPTPTPVPTATPTIAPSETPRR